MFKNILYGFTLCFIASCSNHCNDEILRLGNFENRPRGFQSVYMPGGEIALFIRNDVKEKSKISNVRYFIGKKGNCKKPFRVRLYTIESITREPYRELFKEPLMVSNVKKSGWVTINLEHYNLDFPSKGIFASMEWIPEENFNEVSQTECQYLTYSKMNNENNTWYCALGVNWYQLPNTDFNAMISIDIKKIRPLKKAN